MAGQEKEKRYYRVRRPQVGVDYSAVLKGVRHIVRLETIFPGGGDWIVRIKETGREWTVNPKDLEPAAPE